MKILNCTAVEILPSLLNKTKIQTIRPAFCKDCGIESHWVNKKNGKGIRQLHLPRFKVADKIQILWNQRSNFNQFCCVCGNPIQEGKFHSSAQHYLKYQCKNMNRRNSFDKHLGNAEIIEVFKIVMGYAKNDDKCYIDDSDGGKWYIGIVDKFDKQMPKEWKGRNFHKFDGFLSAKQMFIFFNKKYDLSQPKQFWVYRWRWLS